MGTTCLQQCTKWVPKLFPNRSIWQRVVPQDRLEYQVAKKRIRSLPERQNDPLSRKHARPGALWEPIGFPKYQKNAVLRIGRHVGVPKGCQGPSQMRFQKRIQQITSKEIEKKRVWEGKNMQKYYKVIQNQGFCMLENT